MEQISPIVKCIVCGLKQGGTSFLSSIVSAHSSLATRFECGVLQAKGPRDILSIRSKVQDNIIKSWKVSHETLVRMAEQASFLDAYGVLRAEAPDIGETALLIDKFPDYCLIMEQLLARFDVPILFISRDPRAIIWSRHQRYFWRAGLKDQVSPCISLSDVKIDVDKVLTEIAHCQRMALQAHARYPDRVLILTLEDLITDTETQRQQIFDFLGLEVPSELMGDTRIQPDKVRRKVDRSALDQYAKHMSDEVQLHILERFSQKLRTID